jgi:hypothetical protein
MPHTKFENQIINCVAILITSKDNCHVYEHELTKDYDLRPTFEFPCIHGPQANDIYKCVPGYLLPRKGDPAIIDFDLRARVKAKAATIRSEICMAHNEITKYLKEHGFAFFRDCKNGEIWTDEKQNRVTVLKRYNNPRTFLNLKADVKRAIKAREMFQLHPSEKVEDTKTAITKLGSLFPKKEDPSADQKKETAPVANTAKGTRPKFDSITRARIWRRIEEMHYEGKTNIETAMSLQDEGIMMPNKKNKLSVHYVGSAVRLMKERGTISERSREIYLRGKYAAAPAPLPPARQEQAPPPAPVVVAPAPSQPDAAVTKVYHPQPTQRTAEALVVKPKAATTTKLPSSLRAVLVSDDFSANVKAEALTEWVEEAGDRLPHEVLDALTDPEISNSLKVRLALRLLEGKNA